LNDHSFLFSSSVTDSLKSAVNLIVNISFNLNVQSFKWCEGILWRKSWKRDF
jgi:hypothetical protein